MPIIKSAKKRVRVAAKASVRNSKTKRTLRGALKLFSRRPTTDAHSSVQSAVDKAAKHGVIHKNKASRLKRRAAAQAKASGVKATSKKTAAKPVAKAASAKRVAKKPVAKKVAPKKK